jgi:hypothetical protein
MTPAFVASASRAASASKTSISPVIFFLYIQSRAINEESGRLLHGLASEWAKAFYSSVLLFRQVAKAMID